MLNKKLDDYLSKNYYPFHMPGAKRTNELRADIPYNRDLTEIDGFDNLNNPEDIFKDMEEEIARIYKVNDAIISVNGSTSGILASVRALCLGDGDILIQRSSHKAVYNACEITDLNVDYIKVVTNEIGAVTEIDYDDFYDKLSRKNYGAVVVTSPSYEGYQLDLESIYEECNEAGVPLIVDMAHGSHLVLTDEYKTNFDVAVTSFHKNLSALTPSAAVLINNTYYSKEIRRNMAIFQTSSPSYVILQSIDDMITNFISFKYLKKALDKNLDRLYALNLDHLELIVDEKKDLTKILISTKNASISGEELASLLRSKKIEIEMAYPSYCLLISTIFDSDNGFDRLIKALMEIDKNLKELNKSYDFSYKIPIAPLSFSMVTLSEQGKIDVDRAQGKISAQYIYAYPPGIPLVAPGEIIDKDIISTIKYMKESGIKLNIDDKICIIDY